MFGSKNREAKRQAEAEAFNQKKEAEREERIAAKLGTKVEKLEMSKDIDRMTGELTHQPYQDFFKKLTAENPKMTPDEVKARIKMAWLNAELPPVNAQATGFRDGGHVVAVIRDPEHTEIGFFNSQYDMMQAQVDKKRGRESDSWRQEDNPVSPLQPDRPVPITVVSMEGHKDAVEAHSFHAQSTTVSDGLQDYNFRGVEMDDGTSVERFRQFHDTVSMIHEGWGAPEQLPADFVPPAPEK
jgi:hypothetical protein